MKVKLAYDSSCLPVIFSQNGGKLHFHAPFGALNYLSILQQDRRGKRFGAGAQEVHGEDHHRGAEEWSPPRGGAEGGGQQ